jgi:hypothetical protein
MLTWSIYPLTNLFNRNALTEFMAVAFGMIAFSIFMVLILYTESRKTKLSFRIRYFFYFLVCMTICLGAHPITCLIFSFFFACAILCFSPNIIRFLKDRSNRILLLATMLVVFAIVAPWLYASITTGKDILIANFMDKEVQLYGGVDSFSKRFSLLLPSRDVRVEAKTLQETSTPYLDTQVMMPLLVLVLSLLAWGERGGVFIKRNIDRKRYYIAISASAFLFLLFSVLSLNSRAYNLIPLFRITQFAYRMVSYQNYALVLFAVVFFYFNKVIAGRKVSFYILITFLVSLSFSSLMIKNEHVAAVMNSSTARPFHPSAYDRKQIINSPSSYLFDDYIDMSIKECPSIPIGTIGFDVSSDPLGNVNPLVVNIKSPGIYQLNIVRFRWNSIRIDGHAIGGDNIYGYGSYLVAELPAGNHVLEAVLIPPNIYTILHDVSMVLLCCLLLLTIANAVVLMKGRACRSAMVLKTK